MRAPALALLLAAAPLLAADAPEAEFVAYLPDLGAEISADEVRGQIQLYGDFLADQGIMKARVTVVESVKELEDFVAKRPAGIPTIGVVHPLVVMLMKEEWGLTPLAAPVQQGKSVAGRVVITLRGSDIHGLGDLRGRSVAVTRPWDQLPDLLGLMLFGAPERADAAVKLMLAETSAQAVAAVLGRKADAAMVSSYVFRVSTKGDRRAWQALAEVGETAETHLACIVAFAGTSPELAERVAAALLDARSSSAGRKVLDAFRLDGFERSTVGSLEAVEGKLLARLGGGGTPAAPGLGPVTAERMGGDVGITMKLPTPLAEGESARLHYTVGEASEATTALRCITQTCTGAIAAPPQARIAFRVAIARGEGSERVVGSAELVAP